MLRAISISDGFLYITTDDGEFRDIDLDDGVLTEAELAAVRAVRSSALPRYITAQQEASNEPN